MSDPTYERPNQPYGEAAHSESRRDDPKFSATRLHVGMPSTSIERAMFFALLAITRTVGPGSAFDDGQAGHVIRRNVPAIRAMLMEAMELRSDITPAADFVRKELEG